jgi:hypothetical protein
MDIDLNLKTNNMNKLVFNGLEYELIETPPYPRFIIYGKEYKDIGFTNPDPMMHNIPEYQCFTLRIKDKYYGLKLIEEE